MITAIAIIDPKKARHSPGQGPPLAWGNVTVGGETSRPPSGLHGDVSIDDLAFRQPEI